VLPDKCGHIFELVKCGYNKIDPDIVIAVRLQFFDEFFPGRVMENNGECLNVFSNVIKPPAADYLAVTEDTLLACDLCMKKLGADRVAFPPSAERTAHSGEQNLRFWHSFVLSMKMSKRIQTPVEVDSIP
jgi:hypothetical protein